MTRIIGSNNKEQVNMFVRRSRQQSECQTPNAHDSTIRLGTLLQIAVVSFVG